MDDLLGSHIMELLAEDKPELDRLFAAATSQLEQSHVANETGGQAAPPPLLEQLQDPPPPGTAAHASTNETLPHPHSALPSSTTHPSASLPGFSTAVQQSRSAGTARFPPPKTDEEIRAAREAGIPKKTPDDPKFCVNVYEEWRKEREPSTLPSSKSSRGFARTEDKAEDCSSSCEHLKPRALLCAFVQALSRTLSS